MNDKKKPDWAIEQLQEDAFLAKQVSLSPQDYKEAVENLVLLANSNTNSSKAAAQLLLSLYNGNNWHMDLSDLCLLDFRNLQYALISIRGRVVLSIEPHQIIDNGTEKFLSLEAQWQHLHTNKRYQT